MTLEDKIIHTYKKHGFNSLTIIQKKSIHLISRRINCLLAAPTGSGKTEAAIIPIITLLKHNNPSQKQGIRVIYITPLRSLNNDVLRRIIKYSEFEGLRAEIRHGDSTTKQKRNIVLNPPDILITTPESLSVILVLDTMIELLQSLEWVVVDEIHELFSSERGSDLSLGLERLQTISRYKITRIGLSATLGNFKESAKFLSGTFRKCGILVDKSIRQYDIDIKNIRGTINDSAKYIVDYITSHNINGSVLLFTNTRDEAEYFGSILQHQKNISVDVHHGSLSKDVREETEMKLRKGEAGIVVCTSSLELGLDIGSVDLVIHYGSPRQVSKLLQRIGRSRHNRRLSAKGLIITNLHDDELEVLSIINNMNHGNIEEQKMHICPLDVLSHNLVGLAMQYKRVLKLESVYSIIKNAYPFKDLSYSDFEASIELLSRHRIIKYNPEDQTYQKRIKSYKYYFENLSSIPHILKFDVIDLISKKRIGTLDQKFVGDYGEKGNVFVLRGSQWKILSVNDKKFEVIVEPLHGATINVPYWIGEMIPVDSSISTNVGKLRKEYVDNKIQLNDNILDDFYKKYNMIPDDRNIIIENSKQYNSIMIHSTFGTKINNTLGSLFSILISSMIGYAVETKNDPYRIFLTSSARISFNHIKNIFSESFDLESIIITSFTGNYNIYWKVWMVAKRFGLINKDSIYDKKFARIIYDKYSKTPISKESIRELLHDKYDITRTNDVISKIKNKDITLHWFDTFEFSKLSLPLLEHSGKFYSTTPSNIQQGILELMKERLNKTKQRLICIRCGKWDRIFQTYDIPENLFCPKCRSQLITTTSWLDTDLSKIILKKISGKQISEEENHKFDRAWKVASLVHNFGKKATFVLSGYGIGADSAARILRDYIDEDEMYKQIFEAEKRYVTTRAFWND